MKLFKKKKEPEFSHEEIQAVILQEIPNKTLADAEQGIRKVNETCKTKYKIRVIERYGKSIPIDDSYDPFRINVCINKYGLIDDGDENPETAPFFDQKILPLKEKKSLLMKEIENEPGSDDMSKLIAKMIKKERKKQRMLAKEEPEDSSEDSSGKPKKMFLRFNEHTGLYYSENECTDSSEDEIINQRVKK